jgi:hypothetical protein
MNNITPMRVENLAAGETPFSLTKLGLASFLLAAVAFSTVFYWSHLRSDRIHTNEAAISQPAAFDWAMENRSAFTFNPAPASATHYRFQCNYTLGVESELLPSQPNTFGCKRYTLGVSYALDH